MAMTEEDFLVNQNSLMIDLQTAMGSFLSQNYDEPTRHVLISIALAASQAGLNNRKAYLAQYVIWVTAVATYYSVLLAIIQAAQQDSDLATIMINFAGNVPVNPYVTIQGALAITN